MIVKVLAAITKKPKNMTCDFPKRSATNPPRGDARGLQYWARTVMIAAVTAEIPRAFVA